MIDRIKMIYKKRNEDGFSLIELVIAVGILAILSIVGIVSYSGITNSARKAAVDNAASEVLTGATAYDVDNKKDYREAGEEWMKSASEDNQIVIDATKNGTGEMCVVATNTEHSITAEKGTGCEGNIGTPVIPVDPGGDKEEDEDTTPPIVEVSRNAYIEMSFWFNYDSYYDVVVVDSNGNEVYSENHGTGDYANFTYNGGTWLEDNGNVAPELYISWTVGGVPDSLDSQLVPFDCQLDWAEDNTEDYSCSFDTDNLPGY